MAEKTGAELLTFPNQESQTPENVLRRQLEQATNGELENVIVLAIRKENRGYQVDWSSISNRDASWLMVQFQADMLGACAQLGISFVPDDDPPEGAS